jgi:hypothetical protein
MLGRIEEAKDDKIVRPIGLNDERSEPLVALQGFPEQHEHLGRPLDGFLTTGEI